VFAGVFLSGMAMEGGAGEGRGCEQACEGYPGVQADVLHLAAEVRPTASLAPASAADADTR
jgi:hypothetical protein